MWALNFIYLTVRLIPFIIAPPALLLGSVMAAENRRPNLLFIQTDEQRADTMAAYGNNKIRTPNLDRLARESFVFTRAYVSQPVCTPARSTMITGLWPHTTGLTTNNIPLPDSPICVPERLADNTIVVYTSDHGDMMGLHRLLAKGLMYEESVRVPWLMRVPEFVRHRRKIERPVSHIDMVPTLLDLMGKEVPKELPGHSLVPLMTGGEVAEDHVFVEWPKPPFWRTVISPDGWKLCLRKDGKCQLYNLNTDPGECTNLFYSGQHQDIIGRLTAKIRDWQKRVGDTAEL